MSDLSNFELFSPPRRYRLLTVLCRSLRSATACGVFLLFVLQPHGLIAQTDNATCLQCHDDSGLKSDDGRFVGVSAKTFKAGVHSDLDCVDCHSQKADYDDVPHFKKYVPVDCSSCHDDVAADFKGSVHVDLFADGDMRCVSCHKIHPPEDTAHAVNGGCGDCHDDAVADFDRSVHHLGRMGTGITSVNCASCHGNHHVIAPADTASPVNIRKIPYLCGKCHSGAVTVTRDYVRLPIALPNYLASVHGVGWKEGKRTAVCTDCHGSHTIQTPQTPGSSINRTHLAATCGKCHEEISQRYEASVHGKAVALGIEDSPTCTTCHDEHLIRRHGDPEARVSPEHRAKQLCGDCHTNPALVAKYGIISGVVQTYLDSYHGWAVDRGSKLAATCTDCHNVHEIRSPDDPASSVNTARLTATCGRCHEGVTANFAQSYTHLSALRPTGPHVWVRKLYIYLIVIVLGGMALHNFVVARFELLKHLRHKKSEPYVLRWKRAERAQHLVLLLGFFGLAITGFALRFPDAWWVHMIRLGGHESVRANLHRTFAVILVVQSVYHVLWIIATRRGRFSLREMAPRYWDVQHALQNVAFHLGLRKERPAFRTYDYTEKAEYWALVWGTWVMALSGFVLWFPTIVTKWGPAWLVRVSEVVHFYEAILAVSAIFIWHFFYVIFMPREYPMSTVWLNGRMPASEWKEAHGGQFTELGENAIQYPSAETDLGDGSKHDA
jgi:cytochrome b subunit of formate dehydrogenase